MPADLDTAKYVSFVTYKKDGTPVATPVWVVSFEGGYAFTTDPDAYKVKRLRNDARATLTVCDMRGKIAPNAIVYSGAALVLDEADTQRVDALVRKKYSIGYRMIGVMSVLKKIAGKGSTAGDAAIKVTVS
jgi:PPOX class probable F420-dependent enzyme